MYSLDEIGLIPAVVSEVKHRAEVDPFYNDKLPIFVSPMTCLIDKSNWEKFHHSKVTPIWPIRNAGINRCMPFVEGWVAVTIEEFKSLFNRCGASDAVPHGYYKILIDCANGNMDELFKIVEDAKQEYGTKLVVMIGNIANPETYFECCKSHVDFVRVGIGGGSGCTTSVQTGIHASMPWILEGIKRIKRDLYLMPDLSRHAVHVNFEQYIKYHGWTITKVVADGGITNPSRAIKCLALGADYVMMGKAFAECKEVDVHQREEFDGPFDLKYFNHYYGQSSEQGQTDRFGKVKANPEGTDLWVPVTTTLEEFTSKFEAALRSAMSYCGAKTLDDFIGKVKYEYMSPDEFRAYNK